MPLFTSSTLQTKRIDTNTMPLMSLAATAIDQPQPRAVVEDAMVSYVATDPVVCRMEPGALADKQSAALDPVLQWVRGEVGAKLEPSCSIFGATVPARELEKIRKYLKGLSQWELTAAEQMAASCKSVCVALAAVRGVLGVKEVLRAARLEEDHQIEEWGLVEGGHDIDIADLKVRVAAPAVFLNLLRGV